MKEREHGHTQKQVKHATLHQSTKSKKEMIINVF